MWGLGARLDASIAELRKESREDHIELRKDLRELARTSSIAVKDLSDQNRREINALRADTDRRHTENRRVAWMMLIAVAGALATTLFAKLGHFWVPYP